MRLSLTIICFSILLLVNGNISAQELDKRSHDFGEVANWNNPPATFIITNTTGSRLTLLPIFPTNDLYVEMPRNKIEPGESAEINLYFYTDQLGEFNHSTQLYTSASDRPVKLTVKGEITSLSSSAYTACPGFAPPRDEDKPSVTPKILVIDSITREPIEDAQIALARMDGLTENGTTDNRGYFKEEIPIGLYEAYTTKEPYFPHNMVAYLNSDTPLIIIELVKEEEEIIVFEEFDDPIERPTERAETNPPPPNNPPPDIIEEKPEETTWDDTDLPEDQFSPNNIVFLLDISRSMRSRDKLPLLKQSMKELVEVLRDVDQVSVITYSIESKVVVEAISAGNKDLIIESFDTLETVGWTHGVKGLEKAYEILGQYLIPNGNNQVIISTDGVFNSPRFSEDELYDMVEEGAENNFTLSVVGFGDDADGKRLMRKLARKGEGSYLQFSQNQSDNELLINEIKNRSIIQ